MSYFSEVVFSADHVNLKSFKENSSGRPVLLEELVILTGELEQKLKKPAKDFPNRIKIALEPEEIIFKNIKSPFQDERLLTQAVQFESRKYFRISEEEFMYTYYTWEKESDGFRLTLLGLKQSIIEKYLPFIQAGFVPFFVIKDFSTGEKGLIFQAHSMDNKKESLRIYYNGSLIAWKVYGKGDAKKAKAEMTEYIKSLGLPIQAGTDIKAGENLQEKHIYFTTGPQGVMRLSLKKRFQQMTAVFAGLLILIFITAGLAQISVKKQDLKRIEDEIRKLQDQYQITDLQSIHKKADAKGVELSRIIYAAGRFFPKDKKLSRFEYKDGEAVLTIRGIDVLEANRIKEALENEKSFTQFRIEEGVVSNDKRIIFQVKR